MNLNLVSRGTDNIMNKINRFRMNTSGEYRTVSHSLGLFVVGHGSCIPVDSMDIATTLINSLNKFIGTPCYQ